MADRSNRKVALDIKCSHLKLDGEVILQITEGHLAVMNFKTIKDDPEFSEISSQTDDKNLNFQHPSQTKPQFSVACLTAQLSENAEYDDRTECVLGVGYEGDN